MIPQTITGRGELALVPSKEALLEAFKGKPLTSLRTPCAIVDIAKVKANCARMHKIANDWGALFRAHVKTHKTSEGTYCQLRSTKGSTNSIIVSTLMEAWGVLESGLVKEGIVDDILYGLPVGVNKIQDLFSLRSEMRKLSPKGANAQVRLIIDHPKQVEAVQKTAAEAGEEPWSCFVKIESGGKRAGIEPTSPLLKSLIETISASPHISIYGFYAHAGQSYASKSATEAESFLTTEVKCVNSAAAFAKSILTDLKNGDDSRHSDPFILSVGSTPTAHSAFLQPSSETLKKLNTELNGKLELHAGNYPFLDLQQIATNAIPCCSEGNANLGSSERPQAIKDVALSILSTVISEYPERGAEESGQWSTDGLAKDQDEAMCDAGGLAMSKDSGPLGGFGHVVEPPEKRGWELGRVSQEHGVLTVRKGGPETWFKTWSLEIDGKKRGYPDQMKIGEQIRIVGQHACMIAAAYPYYFVIDSSKTGSENIVSDVWVPWKGW